MAILSTDNPRTFRRTALWAHPALNSLSISVSPDSHHHSGPQGLLNFINGVDSSSVPDLRSWPIICHPAMPALLLCIPKGQMDRRIRETRAIASAASAVRRRSRGECVPVVQFRFVGYRVRSWSYRRD